MKFLTDGRKSTADCIIVCESVINAMKKCIAVLNIYHNGGTFKAGSDLGSPAQITAQLRGLCAMLKDFGNEDLLPFKIGHIRRMLGYELSRPAGTRSLDVISQLRWFLAELEGPEAVERLIVEILPWAARIKKKEVPPRSPKDQAAYLAAQVAELKRRLRSMDRIRKIQALPTPVITTVIRVHSLLRDVSYSL